MEVGDDAGCCNESVEEAMQGMDWCCVWKYRPNMLWKGALLMYASDASSVLWMITVVQQSCLVAGDTFKSKVTLQMHVTEGAKLKRIKILTICSDKDQTSRSRVITPSKGMGCQYCYCSWKRWPNAIGGCLSYFYLMILLNLIVEDKDHNKKVFLIVKVVQEQENNADKNEMVVWQRGVQWQWWRKQRRPWIGW